MITTSGGKGGRGGGEGNTSADIVNYFGNLQPSAHGVEGHLCKQGDEHGKLDFGTGRTEREPPLNV